MKQNIRRLLPVVGVLMFIGAGSAGLMYAPYVTGILMGVTFAVLLGATALLAIEDDGTKPFIVLTMIVAAAGLGLAVGLLASVIGIVQPHGAAYSGHGFVVVVSLVSAMSWFKPRSVRRTLLALIATWLLLGAFTFGVKGAGIRTPLSFVAAYVLGGAVGALLDPMVGALHRWREHAGAAAPSRRFRLPQIRLPHFDMTRLRLRRPPREPRMAGDTSTDPRGAIIGAVTGLVTLLVLGATVPVYSWVLNRAACAYWHVPRVMGHTSPWAITALAAGTLLYLLGSVMNSWPGTREQRMDRRMKATVALCLGFCLFVGGIGFAYRAITTVTNPAEQKIMDAVAQSMLDSQPPAQPTNATKPAK